MIQCKIAVKGLWEPQQVKVRQVTRSLIDDNLCKTDQNAIDDNWYAVLKEKPWTFKGPTIRLIDWHKKKSELILEVIPSDYKERCTLGYLGVAMVPVTKDDYIVLQGPCRKHDFGKNHRVPGCTPTDTDILPKVIQEMYEEFNAKGIAKDGLNVLGLIDDGCNDPERRYTLVVKVCYPGNFNDLEKKWGDEVKDDEKRNEGEPIKLKVNRKIKKIIYEGKGESIEIELSNCLILLLVLENILGNSQSFTVARNLSKQNRQIRNRLIGLIPKTQGK